MVTRRLSLADIEEELGVLEKTHGMSTAEFQERYRKGEIDGMPDFVRWMGLCRMKAASTSSSRAASA